MRAGWLRGAVRLPTATCSRATPTVVLCVGGGRSQRTPNNTMPAVAGLCAVYWLFTSVALHSWHVCALALHSRNTQCLDPRATMTKVWTRRSRKCVHAIGDTRTRYCVREMSCRRDSFTTSDKTHFMIIHNQIMIIKETVRI